MLHGSARATAATRRAIQHRQERLQSLAIRYRINPKTVAKWRKRPGVAAARRGPEPASTVLTAEQAAIAGAFRRHTLLALDGCLHALQATLPHLSRPALHRCFQRHGIRRRPLNEDGQGPPEKKFKDYPVGCLRVDFAEVPTAEGRQYPFVAVDRTGKAAFAGLPPRRAGRGRRIAAARTGQAAPQRAHRADRQRRAVHAAGPPFLPGGHRFDRVCRAHGVEHRPTKPAHPGTNGPVECLNRALKEATAQRFRYQTTEELNEHLQAFLRAYNHAKRLKTLRGLTPHEFVCAQWQKNPASFTRDPTHLTLGLYT